MEKQLVSGREALLSRAWSRHRGVGAGVYRFAGAGDGDNQMFADMAAAPIVSLT
jgi:5-keto 4-deoxyuronate isomerase